MKKKILVLALLPFVLAGCASDGGEETPTGTSTSVPTSAPTSASTSVPTSTPTSQTSEPTTAVVSTSTPTTTAVSASSSVNNSTSEPTAVSISSVPISSQTSAQTSELTSVLTSVPTSVPSSVSTSTSQNPVFATVKAYLNTLKQSINNNPFNLIPETMLSSNSDNFVSASDVAYNFDSHTRVSDIHYGGFGEQWHMVVENIAESKRFYAVLSLCESTINASVVLHGNYLDNATGDNVDNDLDETGYTSRLTYSGGVLTYTMKYKSNSSNGFFGSVKPEITMNYRISTGEKTVRLQLSENNAMKFVLTDNSYSFAIKYGVTAASRKAYFSIERSNDDSLVGKIYEYVQLKDKNLVASAAEFYINNNYTSVVGNKASGMPGFTGYINELYRTSTGKLLGYEVRESFTKWGITATYHTLWFNLNNITGINYVKAVENGNTTFGLGADNNHDIYLNNSSSIFSPAYNKKLTLKTSRKYDVEMRKQYFYGIVDGEITEYETSVPMMFIQADHDSYTNYSDFSTDMQNVSGITASVNLSSTIVSKIQEDYSTLIDVFIEHKASVSSEYIVDYIG